MHTPQVGVRSRNVADALDAARDTAVGHLAQLRREAGRLGRIAPPTDPQLDEFMVRQDSPVHMWAGGEYRTHVHGNPMFRGIVDLAQTCVEEAAVFVW